MAEPRVRKTAATKAAGGKTEAKTATVLAGAKKTGVRKTGVRKTEATGAEIAVAPTAAPATAEVWVPEAAEAAEAAEVVAPEAISLLPHEFLLMVVRGMPIGGREPTFAERVDAAKQILPYYAPRMVSEPPKTDDDDKRLVVTLVRWGDQPPESAVPFVPGEARGIG